MHTHPSLILPTSFRGPARSQSGRICAVQLSLGSGFQHAQMIRHINGLSCFPGNNLASLEVGDGDLGGSSKRLADCQHLSCHCTVHHRLEPQTMLDWCVLVWPGNLSHRPFCPCCCHAVTLGTGRSAQASVSASVGAAPTETSHWGMI